MRKHTEIALTDIGVKMVNTLVQALGHNSNSALAKNIKYTISNSALIIDMDTYGIYLDSGTKPHMPPISAIKPWAEARGLNAWGVAINIKKYGTKAQPFLHSIDSLILDSQTLIADASLLDMMDDIDKILKN